MFGDWKFKIQDNVGYICVDLWLYKRIGDRVQVLNHKGELKTLENYSTPDTDDYFARFEGHEQLQALANELSKYGVKDTNDFKNEGLLEATKAHLEDMRTLVFKKKVG